MLNLTICSIASKTFAERAAWDFLDKEKPNFTLATLCPPPVFGPIVPHLNDSLDALNVSNQRILNAIQGKWKDSVPSPAGLYIWVDVRDLALAHVKAMELPHATNKRFLITAGHFNNGGIAEIVKRNFQEYAANIAEDVSGGEYPKDGMYGYDNGRSKKILGIKYRSLEESMVDTVVSLKSIGA